MPHGGRMKSTLSCVARRSIASHGLLGVGAVVVFDHLDLHALAADRDAAGIVHVLHPELIVRQRGDAGAAGEGAGLGNGVADPDLVLRGGGARPRNASAPAVSVSLASDVRSNRSGPPEAGASRTLVHAARSSFPLSSRASFGLNGSVMSQARLDGVNTIWLPEKMDKTGEEMH